ncbi:hypothetical protein LSCM4_07608 [Leishmania orientalis]|uniref:Uncharacterized protein n=1 Tax=Leishmania orientalis TaxID=2249476 RepID=A0A836L0T0_9TRYP|nr:hypothetical protein LSCM4_07608 [Leishmania orientalis]
MNVERLVGGLIKKRRVSSNRMPPPRPLFSCHLDSQRFFFPLYAVEPSATAVILPFTWVSYRCSRAAINRFGTAPCANIRSANLDQQRKGNQNHSPLQFIMQASSHTFAPSAFDEPGGGLGSAFTLSRVAAARIIQAWVRRRREQQYAHRLLLCLHVAKAARAPADLYGVHSVSPPASPEVREATSSSPCPIECGVADDECFFNWLYETVVVYESALRLENYTRRLLVDEFFATNDVARGASQTTRQVLQQRHPALRSLPLSLEAMQPAVADRVSVPQLPSDSTITAAERLQTYLSPELFAWWRTSQESSKASASVATAAPTRTNAADGDVGSRTPMPLQSNQSDAQTDADVQSEESETMYAEADDQEEEGNSNEATLNAAYARERESADRVAFLRAQQATMAGCPPDFATCNGGQLADVALANASSTSLPEKDDVSLVVQPVLCGVARRRCRGTHEPLEAGSSRKISSAVVKESLPLGAEATTHMCAVCELGGVVARPPSEGNSAAEWREEDELHACAACHALVHSYCASPGDTTDTYYCCSHCPSSGGRTGAGDAG